MEWLVFACDAALFSILAYLNRFIFVNDELKNHTYCKHFTNSRFVLAKNKKRYITAEILLIEKKKMIVLSCT